MNLEQFISFVSTVRSVKNNHLRWGQTVMIVLHKAYPSIYDAVNFTELDCFYDDDKAEALFLHLLGATCDSK